MDSRFLKPITGIPIISTTGLLMSEPYLSHYPLSTTSSKINGIEREGSFTVWIKSIYVTLRPKLIEMMIHKLSNGAKIIQYGSRDKIFRKSFSISDGEKLLQASQCYLYTTVGAIAGILFVSTERVLFCSNRSIKMHSSTGKLLKFQYKVLIPLGKIKGAEESMDIQRPPINYVELRTADDFNFWFMGFINYKKTLGYLHHAISLKCLRNRC